MMRKRFRVLSLAALLGLCLPQIIACDKAAPNTSTGVLAFDGIKTRTLKVRATGAWTIATDQPWLTVTPTSGNGDADVVFTVNRANLSPGNYTNSATISSQSDVRTVKVFMSFPDIEGNVNAATASRALHEVPSLVEGEHVPDIVLAVLNAGGVAIAVGKTIELTRDPEVTDAEYSATASVLALEYGLTVQSVIGNSVVFKANGQSLAPLFANLANDGRIESVSPDMKSKPLTTIPNDPGFADQWHYQLINLPATWSITTGSADIALAVIDTGVEVTHPDLSSRLATGGYDFTTNSATLGDANGHGTHVGGTMAASSNDGTGVAGVTWLNPLIGLKVLGAEGGSDDDIGRAMLFAAGIPVQNSAGIVVTPTRIARVMNLSLGPDRPAPACVMVTPSNVAVEVVERALAAGSSVVFAAGNNNCNNIASFARIPGVITVAAVDRNGARTPYSNAGPEVWISAPGGTGDGADAVISTNLNGSHNGLQGTSMAAPHVAGVIGLMLSVNPNLTPLDIRQIIAQTAQPIIGPDAMSSGSPTQRGGMGHGLINALAAVQAAQTWTPAQSRPLAQLVNVATNAVVQTATVDAGGHYRFANAPLGVFKVRAGNDSDNDGDLGESGELFAESQVTVDEDGDAEIDLDLE